MWLQLKHAVLKELYTIITVRKSLRKNPRSPNMCIERAAAVRTHPWNFRFFDFLHGRGVNRIVVDQFEKQNMIILTIFVKFSIIWAYVLHQSQRLMARFLLRLSINSGHNFDLLDEDALVSFEVCINSTGTFHFYSDPLLWMSIIGRQLVRICFQREQQKNEGGRKCFLKVFWPKCEVVEICSSTARV